MRLMQDEKPIEYHVIEWRNSAFHNHDISVKRKMLGGVSFDGGAISGGSKSGNNITQAGVHEAQPPFSHMYEGNAVINAGRTGLGSAKGKAGTKAGTETLNVKESKEHNVDDSTGTNILNDIITGVINMAGDNVAAYSLADGHDSAIDTVSIKSRRLLYLKCITFKLGRGIRSLLKKNTGDTGKQNRQKPKKKYTSGTRPVTKEDVYEIQVNSSYLLESYNKNGERSTLGRQ